MSNLFKKCDICRRTSCTCKSTVDCYYVGSCINREFYSIISSQSTSLVNFCRAVNKCVNDQLVQVASGNSSILEAFGAAVYQTLKELPDYSDNGEFVLSIVDGDLTWGVGGGSGAVTSVALAMPSIFSVSGSPVTTSGTLTASLINQNANRIFAGPSSGPAAAPTFRNLVLSDIPDLGGNYFKQGGNDFGTVGILGTNDNFPLHFETNGVKAGEINASGNWLLGTTDNGGDKFQVGGNAYLTGNLKLELPDDQLSYTQLLTTIDNQIRTEFRDNTNNLSDLLARRFISSTYGTTQYLEFGLAGSLQDRFTVHMQGNINPAFTGPYFSFEVQDLVGSDAVSQAAQFLTVSHGGYPVFSVKGTGEIFSAGIPNATVDTDKFLVSDNGTIKYRTAVELIQDVGYSNIFMPISNLLDAIGVNTIDNENYAQTWGWSTLTGSGLKLTSSSTQPSSNARVLFEAAFLGSSSSGETSRTARFINSNDDATGTNIALETSATNGMINIAARFTGLTQHRANSANIAIVSADGVNTYGWLQRAPGQSYLELLSNFNKLVLASTSAGDTGPGFGAAPGGVEIQARDGEAPIIFRQGGTDTANERFRVDITETVVNEQAQNKNFRVEGSTDSDLLHVVASTDTVQIGRLNINGAFLLPTVDGTAGQTLVTNGAGIVSWGAGGGGGGGSVSSFSAGNLSPLFTTSVATATSTPALTFSLANAGANTYFGNATSSSTTPGFVGAGALTKVDDTNVTLTLGGNPATSLLRAVSLTLGWTGVLSIARGGTGLGSLGTASQLLRVNAGATALEYFTPSFLTSNQTITLSGDVTGSGTTSIASTIANSAVTYAKIQNITKARILGRYTDSDGVVQEISIGAGLTLDDSTGVLDAVSGGSGTVTSFSAGNLSPLFTSNVATATTTPALTFSLANAGANTYFGNATGSSGAPSYTSAGALTKVDDTNVTLTLGGNPATALLRAASITVGWTGVLATGRGGTGLSSYTTGDLIQASGSSTLATLAAVATGNVLLSGGVGTVSSWGKVGLTTHVSGTLAVGNGGTGVTGTPSNGQLLIGNGSGYTLATITGTTDQVNVTNGSGTITLSTPQDIATDSDVQFESIGIGTPPEPDRPLVISGDNTEISLLINTNTVPEAGEPGYKVMIAGTFTEASSGNHPVLSSLCLAPVFIEAGSATVGNSAMLYISSAMDVTATGGNYGIWTGVAVPNRFDGIFNSNGTSLTANQIWGANSMGTSMEGKTVSAGAGMSVTHGTGSITVASNFNPTVQTLTDGTTITWNVANGGNAQVTLAGTGRTLSISNPVAGRTYTIRIVQDGSGSKTITTWPAGSRWKSGTPPTLSTAGGSIDLVVLYYDGSNYYGTFNGPFS